VLLERGADVPAPPRRGAHGGRVHAGPPPGAHVRARLRPRHGARRGGARALRPQRLPLHHAPRRLLGKDQPHHAQQTGTYLRSLVDYTNTFKFSLLHADRASVCTRVVGRQGKDVGTQYRTGIYYYTAEQESLARASLAEQQKKWEDKIVTEILPAKRFYPAEEYQRYLEKGGQSAEKGCTEPMRCYG